MHVAFACLLGMRPLCFACVPDGLYVVYMSAIDDSRARTAICLFGMCANYRGVSEQFDMRMFMFV